MGKPIRGEGQFPYSIGGFLVNGAKIHGMTFSKQLYINKQRSYKVYDLIDDYGTIYQYIELVYTNENDEVLNYYTPDDNLVDTLKDGTFYLKVQDPSRDIYGFATLYQYHKVKVHTGDYIFRTQDIDAGLSGVGFYSPEMHLPLNDTYTMDAYFIPWDYPNKDGSWLITDDENNCIDYTWDKNILTFTTKNIGACKVQFTPTANPTHTALGSIDVYNYTPPLQYISLMKVYKDDEFYGSAHGGNYLTLSVVPFPEGALPPDDLEFEYDTNIFSDFQKVSRGIYKMFVKKDLNTNTVIYAKSPAGSRPFFSSSISLQVLPWGESYYPQVTGNRFARPGMIVKAKVIGVPEDAIPVYTSSNPAIATIDTDGNVTALITGTTYIRATLTNYPEINLSSHEIIVNPICPDELSYSPRDLYSGIPGETKQAIVTFEPNTIPVLGKWKSGKYNEMTTISEDGIISYNSLPTSTYKTDYYEFIPEGGGVINYDSRVRSFNVKVVSGPQPIEQLKLSSIIPTLMPLGANAKFSVDCVPMVPDDFELILEIEDPTIIEDISSTYDFEYNLTNPMDYRAYIRGIKVGTTKIKFIYKSKPEVFVERTIRIF